MALIHPTTEEPSEELNPFTTLGAHMVNPYIPAIQKKYAKDNPSTLRSDSAAA